MKTTERGAKPLSTAEPVGPVLDADKLAERSQAIAVMNEHQGAVIAQFGDGLPWQAEHYETRIREELRRGCEAFLRAGRYLVVVRECATHGEWLGMLDRLGMEPRQAQRMMEAARRIARLPNASTSTHLVAATKSSGKLIELLSLPEDQFAELAVEGETGDLSLEDVAAMTVRELRDAVREARADLDASRKLVGDGTAKAEKLTKELRAARHIRQRATPDETLALLRERAVGAATQVRADLVARGEDVDSLHERFVALREYAISAGDAECIGDEHDQFMAGLIGELLGELRRVRDTFALPVINDHGAPDWLQDA